MFVMEGIKMRLTDDLKSAIDSLSYGDLLCKWRFAKIGDPMFDGESGTYFSERLKKLKEEVSISEHVSISKELGWQP